MRDVFKLQELADRNLDLLISYYLPEGEGEDEEDDPDELLDGLRDSFAKVNSYAANSDTRSHGSSTKDFSPVELTRMKSTPLEFKVTPPNQNSSDVSPFAISE